MSSKIRRIYLSAVILTVVVGYYMLSIIQRGGGGDSVRSFFSAGGLKFDIPYSRFAGAETLRNIQSNELFAEMEKVIEQNGLPADVFWGLSSRVSDDELPCHTNIAQTLYNLFHEYDTQEPNDLKKLWEASPVGEWSVDKQKFENIKTTLTKFEPKRQIIRRMLDQPETCFYYIFIRPEKTPTKITRTDTRVYTEASKYLADYALLEEYAVARAIFEGNIGESIDALSYIFCIAQLGSTLGSVGVRSDAALVRLQAFEVMQRVVLDPKFEKAHMVALLDVLLEQQKYWTPEQVVWFGDRASGLMLYHRVKMDGLDNALEPADLALLEKRGVKETFRRSVGRYSDADKVFYLRSMQKILDISDQPFIRRQDVLNQIKKELNAKEDTYDKNGIATEPFVAHLLLKDVDRLMEFFAKDQSALDRAIMAILASLGHSDTDSYRDPFTDEPYTVRKVNGLFSISTEHLPRPFRVPIFTEKD